MIKSKKVKRAIQVLGLSATIFAGALTLAGCAPSELELAQQNIDTTVTAVLNDENIQSEINNPIENFTFLCADVEKSSNDNYNIDINGVSNYTNNDKKGYTTLSYEVDSSYFNADSTKNTATLINTMSDIVTNEKYNAYSIIDVNDLSSLNTAIGTNTNIPLDGFKYKNNFVYKVGNVQLSENDNVASFSASELTKFYKTTKQVTYGIVGYYDGKPRYGLVTRTHTDYESFFFDHNIYVQLSPEEFEQAKTDESIIFDKFVEYVNSNQTDKYVVQETNIAKDKEFNANMKGNVQLGDI